ncbi:hypothetical protein ACO0QE_002936 [Hanseniaspora vineae]
MVKGNSGSNKKLSDEEAEQLLLNYLNEQMRPYNINDLMNNLHNAISKTKCLTLLNKLTNEKKIHAKQFGKSNIWVCNDPREKKDSKEDSNDDDDDDDDVEGCENKNKNNEKNEVTTIVTKQEQITAIREEITTLAQEKQDLENYCTEYTEYIYGKDELTFKINNLKIQAEDKKQKLDKLEQAFIQLQNKYLQDKESADSFNTVESINMKIKQEGKKIRVLTVGYKNCIDLIKEIANVKTNDKLDDFLYDELGLERV